MTQHTIGLDAGSVSVKLAVADAAGRVLFHDYRRHQGRPLETAAAMLAEALQRFPDAGLAVTGGAGKAVARRLGAPHVTELSALAAGVAKVHPEVAGVMEMGGEDAKYLILEPGGSGLVRDFALNSVCAAGTGSFLDQQAERIGLSIEAFAEAAVRSKKPPRVAGRCSVFAKSDMIHLQQIATPYEDIVAGLCFAVARNFRGSIVRNRPVAEPVALLGGVALNAGVVRAFREVFGLPDLVIPAPPTTLCALGAALKAEAPAAVTLADLERLGAVDAYEQSGKRPLRALDDGFEARHLRREGDGCVDPETGGAGAPVDAYLGIDIGSISTNLAVVDTAGRLLSKRYLRTASKPIEAVRQGLREVGAEIKGRAVIRGVATTGSGRYMIADFVGADVVKNEITAQAKAAAFIDPDVDTIFEIGGQDSKFISLHKGVITDFEMNKACAAGTGSFLEEQAEKLDVSVKDEFATMALDAAAPCRLGERCTVFMENSLQDGLQRGAPKPDLLAGLAYSIVENYLNRVVAGRPVGDKIFFQGGTAFNKAVVAAFEKHLGRELVVPPNHDVTGAIGMALIAGERHAATGKDTAFLGFDLGERDYALSSFECKACENRCEINKVTVDGREGALFYGGRCEKYDMDKKAAGNGVEDLFGYRRQALKAAHEAYAAQRLPARRGVVGIPQVFFFHEQLPYYATLLWELGFQVRVSPDTDAAVVGQGVTATLADTCFPVKAALGHVASLAKRPAEGTPHLDAVFLPSFINMNEPESPFASGHACPLTQSFPYLARTAFPHTEFVVPKVKLKLGEKRLHRELLEALQPFGVGGAELKRAMAMAAASQRHFVDSVKQKGRAVMLEISRTPSDSLRNLVVIGRAYNAFDRGLNLDIPAKLASLGVRAIPMDFLPADGLDQELARDWPGMYWRSGQRILKAARYARRHPGLSVIYIGNFSCGPDSFIERFMEKEMAGEPFLHIEIDEHSADAGVVTRCEAFLDSLAMRVAAGRREERQAVVPKAGATRLGGKVGGRLRVFIPPMCDHAYGIESAFRAAGVDAQVLPEPTAETVALGRKHSTGKECYPFTVTTGDLLAKLAEPGLDPAATAFFMPGGSGPCRFGQYSLLQRQILDDLGYGDVAVYSPMQDAPLYEQLGIVGKDFVRRSWEGVVAIDMLTKCLHENRPYERERGSADALYAEALDRVRKALSSSNGARDIHGVLARVRRDFEDLPKSGETRPRIGVVGEIFVRSNRFSNEDLVRVIESLGGEAWLAPMDEWIYYVNWSARQTARETGDWKRGLGVRVKDFFQRRIAHGLERHFEGHLHTIHEPDTETTLADAAPYLHHSFRGEAVLSVGKGVDMARKGVFGIVNAMPFMCMPGTVVTGLMRRMSRETGLPMVSVPYDGTASPTNRLTLETFMEQALQRHRDVV